MGDPDAAVSFHTVFELLIRTAEKLPLATRLYGDADLLRLLTQQAGDRELFARTRPSALCNAVMPILHRHGLTRHDRPWPDQAYTVHAVLTGFGMAMFDPATAPLNVDDPAEVLADTVAQLLDPPVAPGEAAITSAAADTIAVLRETRDAVLELIERSQVTGE